MGLIWTHFKLEYEVHGRLPGYFTILEIFCIRTLWITLLVATKPEQCSR